MGLKGRRRHLVEQHLENTSAKLLEKHPDVVSEYVRGRHGIYALYKRSRLYYVGLASNLRSRLRSHLRDKHAGKWDRFSLYVTESTETIRELEGLVMRIAAPKGNKSTTRLTGSRDLRTYFNRRISEKQRRERGDLFAPFMRGGKSGRDDRPRAGPVLAPYIANRYRLRLRYKGKTYRATARRDGWIRMKGKRYRTPTAAAKAIVPRTANGWHRWEYEAAPDQWRRLKELRRRKRR